MDKKTSQGTFADWAQNQNNPALASVLQVIVDVCKDISTAVTMGEVQGLYGLVETANVHGEEQKKLDIYCHELMARALHQCPRMAAWASEEMEKPECNPAHQCDGDFLAVFDPLDGSSNVEPNGSIGTIFSVLPHIYQGTPPGEAAFLQPGTSQLAAGYVLYGPATVLVITTGAGVDSFTLNPQTGDWIHTRTQIQVPKSTREFAINCSNQQYWEKPVQRYIGECIAGQNGPRRTAFNMRWVGAMVADAHRILCRGGVYLYPRDNKEPQVAGRLRLTYEAAPIAFLMEQAGGQAITGTQRIMDVVPDLVHQKIPVIFGSSNEIEIIHSYHEDPSENVTLQLFKSRSLFVQA